MPDPKTSALRFHWPLRCFGDSSSISLDSATAECSAEADVDGTILFRGSGILLAKDVAEDGDTTESDSIMLEDAETAVGCGGGTAFIMVWEAKLLLLVPLSATCDMLKI